jgi:PKD repeat protein
LTGSGSDSDGLISKASFDFGDGQAQDVTDGLNLSSVTPQISHTYQNAGAFNATVTFTDNGGSVSNSCTEVVTVSAPQQTTGPTAPPATDTPRPTLAATGSSATILGIAGGIMVVIVGALVIFAL